MRHSNPAKLDILIASHCTASQRAKRRLRAPKKNPDALRRGFRCLFREQVHFGVSPHEPATRWIYLSDTFRLRPTRRLRLIILRPLGVFMRARKPMERLRLMRLMRCG
jgi:hypothetical protein